MNSLIDALHTQPVLTLFLTRGMGYLIGNIRIDSFSLGAVAGVLVAGLVLGRFEFRRRPGCGFRAVHFLGGLSGGTKFLRYTQEKDGVKLAILRILPIL